MSDERVQPAARAPAPGALWLVQRFVNTNDIEGDREDLNQPDDLRAFLVERHLLTPEGTIDEAGFRRAREIREAIRALLYHNTGEGLDEHALATLNDEARKLPLAVRFAGDGSSALEPIPDGIDASLARLLGIIFASMADGTWVRLKACRRHACRWAFYDRSKNGSSRWCSMKICGSREKAKAYRRRKTAEPT